MNDALVVKSKLFVQNRDILKSELKWASSNMIPLCAYLYAEKGLRVDVVRINECKQIIKKEIGVFSKIKGDTFYPLATELSLINSKEKGFARRVEIYNMLKKEFGTSMYLPWIAFSLAIAEKEQGANIEQLIGNALSLEDRIKNELLDPGFQTIKGIGTLLLLSKKSEDELIQNLKIAYEVLLDTKIEQESIVLVCYMLAAGTEEIEDSCEKMLSSYSQLGKQRCKFEKEDEATALGMLANSKQKEEEYIKKVVEINTYLSEQKGFDIIDMSSHERHLYSVLLAASDERKFVEERIALLAAIKNILLVTVQD